MAGERALNKGWGYGWWFDEATRSGSGSVRLVSHHANLPSGARRCERSLRGFSSNTSDIGKPSHPSGATRNGNPGEHRRLRQSSWARSQIRATGSVALLSKKRSYPGSSFRYALSVVDNDARGSQMEPLLCYLPSSVRPSSG